MNLLWIAAWVNSIEADTRFTHVKIALIREGGVLGLRVHWTNAATQEEFINTQQGCFISEVTGSELELAFRCIDLAMEWSLLGNG
jgi:hypothetical protein